MSKSDQLLGIDLDHPTVFEVRRFSVREAIHHLFRVELEVVSEDLGVDLDTVVGREARFRLRRGDLAERAWSGLVTDCVHVGIDVEQLGTYRLIIEPKLWLLTQRRNYRVFQQLSDPEIAVAVLRDWGIDLRTAFEQSLYPARKYRVQYAESDYSFVRRLLEDAGVSFYFEDHEGSSRLVLDDTPHGGELRAQPLTYESAAIDGLRREIAYEVRVKRRLRPGHYTQGDVDYRREPDFPLAAEAKNGLELEQSLERYHLNYGAFLFRADASGETPVADDRGAARTRLDVGRRQVERRLAAQRADARRCYFRTTAHDLAPGRVFHFSGHPRPELATGQRLLVIAAELEGDLLEEWEHRVDAGFADTPFHPPLDTPKPRATGIESATVVGPDDDEIHTDEFARVRVQFHWDREGQRDPQASCWIPVSQPWGGAGFGAVNIPRVGQEVLIQFLGADPDRPVVQGRVFTKNNPVPYKLPEHKTVSGIRSRSANRMMMGANDPPGVADLALEQRLAAPAYAHGPTVIQSALDGNLFNAESPDGGAHRWPGSEVTMDDSPGQELLYMQAERDMNTVVKNNQTTIVGGQRATRIGGDDVLDIDHQQFISVGSDRMVQVEGGQRHVVTGDIIQESIEGSQHFVARELIRSGARTQFHSATEAIAFQVGQSWLLMKPEFVLVQSAEVYMNPGPDALQTALMTGEPPPDPHEVYEKAQAEAAAAFDAEVAAARQVIDQAWQDNALSSPYQVSSLPAQYPEIRELDRAAYNEAFNQFMMDHPPDRMGYFPRYVPTGP